MIDDARIASIAEALEDACARHDVFTPLRIDGQAADLDTAYRIQARIVARRRAEGGGELAGYKCGLTSATMQAFCNVSESIAGRVLASGVRQSPATLNASRFGRLGLECEMALRIARPVPAIPDGADARVLMDCVASAHAAFETIDDRNADYTTLNAPSIVAENSWNGGLVAAEGVDPRLLADLHDVPGVLSVNGVEIGRGNSSAVLGGPLNVLAWLARFLDRNGEQLQPGQWVMTGSMIPTIFAQPGETATFAMEGLPPVSATVVA